jgi:hypothetical protein
LVRPKKRISIEEVGCTSASMILKRYKASLVVLIFILSQRF